MRGPSSFCIPTLRMASGPIAGLSTVIIVVAQGGIRDPLSTVNRCNTMMRRYGFSSGRLDLFDNQLGPGSLSRPDATDVIDNDRRAAARQFNGIGPTDSPAGAGDDRHLASERY